MTLNKFSFHNTIRHLYTRLPNMLVIFIIAIQFPHIALNPHWRHTHVDLVCYTYLIIRSSARRLHLNHTILFMTQYLNNIFYHRLSMGYNICVCLCICASVYIIHHISQILNLNNQLYIYIHQYKHATTYSHNTILLYYRHIAALTLNPCSVFYSLERSKDNVHVLGFYCIHNTGLYVFYHNFCLIRLVQQHSQLIHFNYGQILDLIS